jgi:hypothetical protein
MGFMDKLTAGAERAAREAEKAFDKGKAKVGELQIEMQMDGLAKKLGYLVFDFYRGREVDQAMRQSMLDDLSRLEDQLLRMRAEAAARSQGQAAEGRAAGAPSTPEGEPGQTSAGYGDPSPGPNEAPASESAEPADNAPGNDDVNPPVGS